MTLNLYNTTDDPRVVNKTLTSIKTITGTPTEDISILAPTFIIDNDTSLVSVSMFDVNYLYCSELGRYYFVTIDLLAGKQLRLKCTIDPLMSYVADLVNCQATVVRSESTGITAIPDNKLPIDPNREEVLSILLDKDPFNVMESVNWMDDPCYLITVVGNTLPSP